MRKCVLGLLVLLSSPCLAGDFTQWGVPTRVDVVRNEGVMVYGSFGNPNGCTIANQIFIPIGHSQYNQIYAMLLMALAAGKPIQAYVDQCATQGWYAGSSTTFNQMDPCCSIYVGS